MDPTETSVESFDRFAQHYADTFMDHAAYLQTHDAFDAPIKPQHTRLLDIACGPGNIASYLSKKRPDLQVTGVDLSEQGFILKEVLRKPFHKEGLPPANDLFLFAESP